MNPTLVDLENNLIQIDAWKRHTKRELEVLAPQYQSMGAWVEYWIEHKKPALEEKDKVIIEAFKHEIANTKLKHFRTEATDHVGFFLDELKHAEVPRAMLALLQFIKWFEMMVCEDPGYYSDRHPF